MEHYQPRQPLATWNPASSVWETQESHICGHSVVFSETWPSSGMTRAGVAYALPTWEPPTDAGVCSSSPGLLPTPQAHDAVKGKTAEQVARMRSFGHGVANLNEVVENTLAPSSGAPGSGAT